MGPDEVKGIRTGPATPKTTGCLRKNLFEYNRRHGSYRQGQGLSPALVVLWEGDGSKGPTRDPLASCGGEEQEATICVTGFAGAFANNDPGLETIHTNTHTRHKSKSICVLEL